MGEWRELAERLVEIDFRIEDLGSWATEPEDVEELERLEELRDEVLAAVGRRRIPHGLRERLRATT
jgi:hypothetical protein